MPWPKGKPLPVEMLAGRIVTLRKALEKRRRKPDAQGRWRCGRCGQWKEAAGFHRSNRTSNGLKSQCKLCHQEGTLRTADPDKKRAARRRSESKRRARKAGVGSNMSLAAWSMLRDVFDSVCLACGATDKITWDHIVPISRGGEHRPVNLQPLCRSCNERKQAVDQTDYRTTEQRSAVEFWAIEFKLLEGRGGPATALLGGE